MRVNVSDLLLDPDLGSTTFTRQRPTTTLANQGEAYETYAPTVLQGIVQAASTADLNLLPEGTRISDVQAFFSATDMSVGGSGQNPDVLQYDGKDYVVRHVQDFGGHGMVRALAQYYPGGIVSPPPPGDDDGP
jgi:hypothetical protein